MKTVDFDTPLPLSFVGPDLSLGPLPCIVYLSLSSKESLLVDPYNQPVEYWKQFPCRVFSVDLPFHGEGFQSGEAMTLWANAWNRKETFFERFLTNFTQSLSILFKKGVTKPLAIAGLSRGGFVAYHIAAKFSSINTIVTYAPLTDLNNIKEIDISTDLQQYSLHHITDILSTKTNKTFIGNRDTRVGTNSCFQWIRQLTENAYQQGIRSPPIELEIKPSIGYQGHGTSKESFEKGAAWIWQQLTTQ